MLQADANIETVTLALTEITKGHLKEAMAQFEEDAKWRCAQWLAEAGDHDGQAEISRMWGMVNERMGGGMKLLNLTLHGGGEYVFAEYTKAGGSDSYSELSEHVLSVFHVVMGRIREVREFTHRIG